MASDGSKRLGAADALLQHRLSFAEFLAKLPPKDRVNAERRVGVLEASPVPELAELWRRLACALMTLAPHAAKLVGKQTVQFYVADGKYRMQVFALEDLQDGNITIYGPDVLTDAVEAGLLVRPPTDAGGSGVYGIAGSGDALRIDALDRDSENLVAHFKDMVGWNRTAVRITLPPTASPGQVDAAERLCAIAALRFAASPAPTTTPPPGGVSPAGAHPRDGRARADAPVPPRRR
jgi:hypothetical protein